MIEELLFVLFFGRRKCDSNSLGSSKSTRLLFLPFLRLFQSAMRSIFHYAGHQRDRLSTMSVFTCWLSPLPQRNSEAWATHRLLSHERKRSGRLLARENMFLFFFVDRHFPKIPSKHSPLPSVHSGASPLIVSAKTGTTWAASSVSLLFVYFRKPEFVCPSFEYLQTV